MLGSGIETSTSILGITLPSVCALIRYSFQTAATKKINQDMMLMQQKKQTRGPVTAGFNALIVLIDLMQNIMRNLKNVKKWKVLGWLVIKITEKKF